MEEKLTCGYIFKQGAMKDKKCSIAIMPGEVSCKKHKNYTNKILKVQETNNVETNKSTDVPDNILNTPPDTPVTPKMDPEMEKDLDFIAETARKDAPNLLETGKTVANRPVCTNMVLVKAGIFAISGFAEQLAIANDIPMRGLQTECITNQEFLEALTEVCSQYSEWVLEGATPEMKLLACTLQIVASVYMKNATAKKIAPPPPPVVKQEEIIKPSVGDSSLMNLVYKQIDGEQQKPVDPKFKGLFK